LANAPADVLSELRDAAGGVRTGEEVRRAGFCDDFLPSLAGSLAREFERMAQSLTPAGMLWVSWPKKSSGVATESERNIVREIGLDADWWM